MADSAPTRVRTRAGGGGGRDAARSAALERLRAMRSGGARSSAPVVKPEEPIFETLSEEAYDKLVAERREEARSFIVDDEDGDLGYGDDGHEEDWTHVSGNLSGDEYSDGDAKERERRPKKKIKPSVRKVEKPVPIEKQRLVNMATMTGFKKSEKVKGSGSDDVVNQVIDDLDFNFEEWQSEKGKGGARVLGLPHKDVKVNTELPVFYKASSNCEVNLGESSDLGGLNGANECEKDGNLDLGTDSEIEKSSINHGIGKSDAKKEANTSIKMNIKEEEIAIGSIKVDTNEVAVKNGEVKGNGEVCEDVRIPIELKAQNDDKSNFELNKDGGLPFYMIDAYEQPFGGNSGKIYLFGKVKVGKTYQSCCVIVKNMPRCVYAIPKSSVFPRDKIEELEMKYPSTDAQKSSSFRAELQEMASELKNEIAEKLSDLHVSSFMLTPVKRNYAFERSDVPLGEQYVLKINYSFTDKALDSELKGENFQALLGTRTSALELFLIKRKINGPCWLTISEFTNSSSSPSYVKESWCRFEITVDFPKKIASPASKKKKEISEISPASKSVQEIPPASKTVRESPKEISPASKTVRESPKEISPASETVREIPPLVSVAINLKTLINEKTNLNEIVSASLVCCHNTKIDGPVEKETEWRKDIYSCTVIRQLDGIMMPIGYKTAKTEWNKKPCYKLEIESSERALINRLMAEIYKLDPDVLVGHNISGFDLDVLLHRCQAYKLPGNTWSKIGRLKWREMPKLKGGKSIYGSGASPGIMTCLAGRLLCDTYLSSRDLLKAVSYSLTELSKTELREERKEIAPHQIPSMYQHVNELLNLARYGENDAMLSLKLMFKLSIMPLTRQLTNISGNLWSKTLQNARAQRVEYFLLHAFHEKKFIVPDKWGPRVRESNPNLIRKRKVNGQTDDAEEQEKENNNDNNNDDDLDNVNVNKKKGPSYAGGLVLEPKTGLYDKCVLLLDFNSLYPSIIQEFNICFTTVERSVEGIEPSLPSTRDTGVLPELLRKLVERRRGVKERQKKATKIRWDQLNIEQQALKLTANSIYGCLGFSNSRFYAKPLAELITLQGRRILQSTVDLVQDNLSLEVIYGDTDSIMINTGLDDVNKAYEKAKMVIQEVNKRYKCMEIDLDGFYKRLLLLKKKKYAGMKLIYKIDHTGVKETDKPKRESKGVDMVRRDWSLISVTVGDFCLDCILDERISSEEAIEKIHARLREVRVQLTEEQEKMKKGEVIDLRKYEITKTLTKPPEDYPDARNQPHVQVALRMKKNGHTGCSAGHTIPYIICSDQVENSGPSSGIAQRARHRDELKGENKGQWLIDIDYYLSQQIHPVVTRLCASIQGTSPARLAECLGLDSSRFHSRVSEPTNQDSSSVLLSIMDEEERYKGCEQLMLTCPSCASAFECPPVSSLLTTSTGTDSGTSNELNQNFWHKMRCPKCPSDSEMCVISPPMLANQVKRQADSFISTYYKGLMVCDVETCKYATRTLNLRLVGDSERGTVCPRYPSCDGHLVRTFKEADLYKQLSYFCYVLDSSRCLDKLDLKARAQFENQFGQIGKIVDFALEEVERIRDRCDFGWVRLSDFCVSI
ncbi:hypothetical protein LUZ60_001699 [Juncus effusus]|nr:hypothetical protein LUZ60_001699 [Juncus effusus]